VAIESLRVVLEHEEQRAARIGADVGAGAEDEYQVLA
jgi:hypothetical protein